MISWSSPAMRRRACVLRQTVSPAPRAPPSARRSRPARDEIETRAGPRSAPSAAVFRSSASGSKAYQRKIPVCCSVTFPNSTCSANQTVRLRITPTTAAVIAASAPVSIRLERNCSTNGAPAKIQSIEARERHPGRHRRGDHARRHRRERRGLAIACEEADELRHQDQRAGRRLGESQPVDHFLRRHPALRVDRFLRHIGKQRIGAAETHHRELGEEGADIDQHMLASER